MEFHSVTVINGAASDALELSSSASNSSSSSSSSQSSPHNNSPSSQSSPDNNSLSASSPDLAPPTSQAEQSVSISITVARVNQPRPTKAEILKSLKESIAHRMKLEQLQKSERGYQKDASSHKKTVRRLSKELYLIMSLYALLQGVLFTAVAQSSVFTCGDLWGPAGVVGAVTLGTVRGVLEKLRRMGSEKQEVKKFEIRQSAVYDKIEQLYFRGAACNIDTLEPNHNEIFDPAPDILCIFSLHGLLVLGFLLGFSALILASYTQMLCRNCHCKKA